MRAVERVLVLGVPRSGTTWIAEALGRCRGARYVHEPDGVNDPFAYRAKQRFGGVVVLEPGSSAPDYERLWAGAFAGGTPGRGAADRIARWCYGGVDGHTRGAVRDGASMPLRLRVACALARPRAAVEGADAIVVKSVDAALACEWIYERFAPRVVVVRRDLRSVLASWVALGMAGPRRAGYEATRDHARRAWQVELPPFDSPPLERGAAVCATWSAAIEDARRRQPAWLALDHESVCIEPGTQLRGAARSVGLNWTDAVDDFLAASDAPGEGYATRRVRSEQAGSWKRRLTADQVGVIESIIERFPRELLAITDQGIG